MQLTTQNNNEVQQKSIKNLTDLMENVLAKAKKLGATEASVAVNHDNGFSVDVRMSEAETVAFNEDKGLSVVVYIGCQKGSASSTDTSAAAIDDLVHKAFEIAKVSAPDPCFGLPDKELMQKDYPNLDLYHPWEISPSEAIEIALRCEDKALKLDKRINNSDGVNLSTYQFCHGFANSFGGQGFLSGTRHSLSCSLIANSDAGMQRDYDYTTARKATDLMDVETLATNTVERTISRIGARKIKTQKAAVLFSARVSSGLVSNFINAISGGNLYRKNSFLLDSIDKQIFPQGLKIYEQPWLTCALGSTPFDGEGVPTRNNVFVEDGRVKQYVLSTYSARRMGLKTTANAGGVYNLTVDANAGDLDELIKTMHTGLLITELMGQGVNGLTGDYSRGATGFWVENGQIQFPVEEVTIAGNLKEMFKSIAAVGNDINRNLATRCGSILIEQMMIAGE